MFSPTWSKPSDVSRSTGGPSRSPCIEASHGGAVGSSTYVARPATARVTTIDIHCRYSRRSRIHSTTAVTGVTR